MLELSAELLYFLLLITLALRKNLQSAFCWRGARRKGTRCALSVVECANRRKNSMSMEQTAVSLRWCCPW